MKDKIIELLKTNTTIRDSWNLDDMRQFAKHLGNPQDSFKSIIVTGTNGKGSTTTMIASVIQEAGFKVGKFISPHIIKFNERISINNKEISDEELEQIIKKIKPYSKDYSYFEIGAAIAFLYFKENNVDIAVLEVGMGGRLDATNICNNILSVITNVTLEHTLHLGNTIEKIAYEKAGIIKANTICVTSAKDKALEVIEKECKKI